MRVDGIKLKHKRLVDEFVRNGGNGAQAWRTVYAEECRRYRNANTPAQSFYLYIRKPRIRAYLSKKLERMIKRGQITEEAILTKYEKAYQIAESQAKASEMVAAATAQAKLVGLLRDRIEAGPPGSFANMENVSDVLEALGEQIGADAAMQIGQALGVLPSAEEASAPEPVKPERTLEQAIELLEADSPSDAVN